jgi:hypothetical protein
LYGKCKQEFIGDHSQSDKSCHSFLTQKILLIPVRGTGIRDMTEIEKISIGKVLPLLVNPQVAVL